MTNKLIDESLGTLLKDIIGKHYNSYEKINNNEIRIIIDLRIVYIEIKNNLNLIIDRLVDKFKIVNRDAMFKLFVNHIYDDDTKENIMKINKIVSNQNLKTPEQFKKAHVDYLYGEFFITIFNDQIVDFIKFYSDPLLIYVYYSKNLIRNWKLILFVIFVLFIFYLTIKKLKLCNI